MGILSGLAPTAPLHLRNAIKSQSIKPYFLISDCEAVGMVSVLKVPLLNILKLKVVYGFKQTHGPSNTIQLHFDFK